ncbi:glycosyl hydrolase family 95 catalytic domain-containing protein [Streptomyces sp. XY152]|uniref:glycoside hydrolase family 95 protein n=1 Tax=Streptomyces sp. XY152 TaxID=1415560 RepID=UPI0006AF3A06|nr:glycoside hydrolase family 95 protein [Streptomyces sp. XY152]KOV23909.1 alpha/beta hydrolase [Streptomyces sp. XY152]
MQRRGFLTTSVATSAALTVGLPLTARTASAAPWSAPEASRLVLWYDKPAAQWLEALPLGNGRLGAMVFGGPDTERLQLNEDTLWAGGPYEPANPRGLAGLPEIRRRVFAGEWAAAQQLIDSTFMGDPLGELMYQTVGNLRLSFAGMDAGEVTGYRRELDLDTAVATTTYTRGNVAYRREVFASHPDQVIVVRLTADGPGALSFTAAFDSPQQAETSSPDRITAALEGTGQTREGVPGQVRFRALVRAHSEGGAVRSENGTLTVDGADAVTLLVSVGSSYNNYRDASGDHRARAERPLNAAAGAPYGKLRSRHVRDHRALFGRLSLDLGTTEAAALPTDQRVAAFAGGEDPHLVTLHYQYGRYLLIASSRPGTQPATLQGIWNEELSPPWDSKYTININTEMNYWPAPATNLLECWEPVFALLDDLAEAGRRTARVQYGADGWVAHHNTDVWRGTAPVDGAFWGMWPTGGAWLATSVWEHYRFTGDRAALRRRLPVLEGAVRFFLDALVPDPTTGHLVTCPSVSPENAHHPGVSACAGPTMDNQILRDLFDGYLAACDTLGISSPYGQRVREARAGLPPMKIGAQGQLQEWQHDWDAGAPEQHHRHVSHLYGLHPSNQITKRGTPDLFRAALRTLELRGDAGTGWSLAWKINFWARAEDGARSFKLLTDLLTPERTAPNLFDLHPPFQIDGNFGATAGVTEWLLQSHTDEVHLLPALPPQLPDGQVTGLLARGGLTVDLTWRGGELRRARLSARQGGTVRLRTAVPVTVRSADGAAPEVRRPEKAVSVFRTKKGGDYVITPR